MMQPLMYKQRIRHQRWWGCKEEHIDSTLHETFSCMHWVAWEFGSTMESHLAVYHSSLQMSHITFKNWVVNIDVVMVDKGALEGAKLRLLKDANEDLILTENGNKVNLDCTVQVSPVGGLPFERNVKSGIVCAHDDDSW